MQWNVFVKGLIMGACDLVPGISGGTIAFVSGIYTRFINALVTLFSVSAFVSFLSISLTTLVCPTRRNRQRFHRFYATHDLYFLVTLFLGILTAVLLLAPLILYLLATFFVETIFFFMGLIVASAIVLLRSIPHSRLSVRVFSLFGLFFGSALVFLVPQTVSVTPLYLFVSGFFGVFAMFLPGISGSYILYLMGSYTPILEALTHITTEYAMLFVFLCGALLGAVCVTHSISWLLMHHHGATVHFLFGFVLGALLIPLRDVLTYGFTSVSLSVGLLLFSCACFGVLFVLHLRPNIYK